MVKNWLITGGCGFLGTSLIKRILMDGSDAQIIVLDNLTVGSRDDLSEVCSFSECASESIKNKSGVKLIVGDICEPATCNAVSENIDCIVHFAANTGVGPSVEDPRSDMEANVIGTFNMLESARLNGVKHFVFASSGAPAGNVIPPIHEEMAPHPVSPYGASKLAGEGYCSSYYQTFNINTVVLRFGNVYGPGSKNKSSVVAKFIRRASEGKCCEILFI
jgi:UDP-glucose 4-epimerase